MAEGFLTLKSVIAALARRIHPDFAGVFILSLTTFAITVLEIVVSGSIWSTQSRIHFFVKIPRIREYSDSSGDLPGILTRDQRISHLDLLLVKP
jgi:hypothetical protein